ncbi:LacI family DNA-binding transcriptional regulator [Cellvibrio sp.]|uniref:LacI family DNA-binding transcriptional regulator n=1 Tax=Cellvibrio sp. TaxID=1965322 RepID=UPI0039647489
MAKATIDDVAALAGVSMKTVSRVMNKEPNVRPATREKVEAAVAQLDYRPNLSARSLAGNRSYLLGLLYGIPSAHYVLDIQEGALDVCRPEGYELLVHPCNHQDPNITQEIVDLMRDKRIDGVMLTPPISDNLALMAALKKMSVPFVRVAPTENKSLSPYVETNDQEASYDMTCKLIALGHKRIGFICGHPDHRAVTLRYDGYKAALIENNIPISAELVEKGLNSFESGEACARKLLQKKSRPTAIFAANDDMAAGVMMVAHQMGIKIPQELSVAGFDDTPVAHQIWPALTTVRQPIQPMAKKATELLIKQLRGKDVQLPASMLTSTIIVRESTGVAPKKSN